VETYKRSLRQKTSQQTHSQASCYHPRLQKYDLYVPHQKLEPNDHSLLRATKKIKRPTPTVSPLLQEDGSWARSNSEKAQVFAEHLNSTFAPLNTQADEEINSYLNCHP
jgi:hypothetical protein